MDLTLFTGDGCQPCHDAEEYFKKKFKEEIDAGEADVVNLDENEDAQQFWAENDLPVAPCMVITSDKGKLIAVLDADDLLNEASPAPAAAETEAVKVPSESKG